MQRERAKDDVQRGRWEIQNTKPRADTEHFLIPIAYEVVLCSLFQRLFHFLLSSKTNGFEEMWTKNSKTIHHSTIVIMYEKRWLVLINGLKESRRGEEEKTNANSNLIYIYVMAFVHWSIFLWMHLIDHQFDLITLAIVLSSQLQM